MRREWGLSRERRILKKGRRRWRFGAHANVHNKVVNSRFSTEAEAMTPNNHGQSHDQARNRWQNY